MLFLPLVLYWLTLLILTSLPSEHITDIFTLSDKLKHFFGYLVLATLLSLNLKFQEKWLHIANKYFLYAFTICITYGILDEIHQMFVPNRSAEFYDWVADMLGSFSGAILSVIFVRLITKNKIIMETK